MTTSLRTFDQLLAWLPDELGFVPEASVVLVALDRGEVVALLRLPDNTPGLREGEDTTVVHEMIGKLVQPRSPSDLILVEYRADSDDLDLVGLHTWLSEAVAPVTHVLIVVGEVWWATTCDRGCCDGAMHPVPAGRDLPLAGHRSWPRDPYLSAQVEEAAPDPTGLDPDVCLQAWRTVMMGSTPVSVPALAIAVSAYRRTDLRDVLLACVVPEMGLAAVSDVSVVDLAPAQRDELADAAPRMLPKLVALVPEQVRPYWLALLCLARWRAGDLTGAREAGRQAIEEGPEVVLAELAWSVARSQMPYPWGKRRSDDLNGWGRSAA